MNELPTLSPTELKVSRVLLLLSTEEAAKLIGKASPRAWQRWESADRSVPQDVSNDIRTLLEERNQIIASLRQAQEVNFYRSKDAFLKTFPNKDPLAWRVWQSAAASLFVDKGISLKD